MRAKPSLNKLIDWLASPSPYLLLVGMGIFLSSWYLFVELWKLPRFEKLPGLSIVVREWLSESPMYGLSVFTPEYYSHIWVSLRRVLTAFVLATVLGVPLGVVS